MTEIVNLNSCAPVALFVYNRPEHTKSTVEALQLNTLASSTELFIFSDAAKSIEHEAGVLAVRNYIINIQSFASVTIVYREYNFGLAKSIIDGVSFLCKRYGRVIVLEDDLLTSKWFLKFMNDGLSVFEHEDAVMAVCGYLYPVNFDVTDTPFFLKMPSSWGWATWARNWNLYETDGSKLLNSLEGNGLISDFDKQGPYSCIKMLKNQISGKNNSWFVRWHACAHLHHKLTLYPPISLVRNIGFDGSGVHCAGWKFDPFVGRLADRPVLVDEQDIVNDNVRMKIIKKYFLKIRLARYFNYAWRLLRSRWCWWG